MSTTSNTELEGFDEEETAALLAEHTGLLDEPAAPAEPGAEDKPEEFDPRDGGGVSPRVPTPGFTPRDGGGPSPRVPTPEGKPGFQPHDGGGPSPRVPPSEG